MGVRFECEIENYSSMEHVLAKLDMKTVKLSGFQVRVFLREIGEPSDFFRSYLGFVKLAKANFVLTNFTKKILGFAEKKILMSSLCNPCGLKIDL